MIREAVFSEDRRYRYRLYREWEKRPGKPLLWVLLNPSTADETIDDPTIRRCIGFSTAWGYGSMWLGNIYAYRATDAAVMKRLSANEARGPHNYSHLISMAAISEKTVCAWGAHRAPDAETLYDISVGHTRPLYCLGKTRDGSPRHPLYLSATTPLEPYEIASRTDHRPDNRQART